MNFIISYVIPIIIIAYIFVRKNILDLFTALFVGAFFTFIIIGPILNGIVDVFINEGIINGIKSLFARSLWIVLILLGLLVVGYIKKYIIDKGSDDSYSSNSGGYSSNSLNSSKKANESYWYSYGHISDNGHSRCVGVRTKKAGIDCEKELKRLYPDVFLTTNGNELSGNIIEMMPDDESCSWIEL